MTGRKFKKAKLNYLYFVDKIQLSAIFAKIQ